MMDVDMIEIAMVIDMMKMMMSRRRRKKRMEIDVMIVVKHPMVLLMVMINHHYISCYKSIILFLTIVLNSLRIYIYYYSNMNEWKGNYKNKIR